MVSCAVKEYLEGEQTWKDAVSKQEEKNNWLDEILGEGDADKGKPGKEKKRKRKRHNNE